MSESKFAQKFKTDILDLVALTRGYITRAQSKNIELGLSTSHVDTANSLLNAFSGSSLLELYCVQTYPYWKEISNKNKDPKVITDCLMSLFSDYSSSMSTFLTVFTVKDSSGKDFLSEDDYEDVFCSLKSLCVSSIREIHSRREWSPSLCSYTNTYIPSISLKSCSEMFNVKLSK